MTSDNINLFMNLTINLKESHLTLPDNIATFGYDLNNSTYRIGKSSVGYFYLLIHPDVAAPKDKTSVSSPVPEVIRIAIHDYIIEILSEDIE